MVNEVYSERLALNFCVTRL